MGEGPAGRRRERVVLALIALAVLVRIAVVGLVRFTGDESYFWATARNIARGEAWPVYGPPLTGSDANHPGPIFFYLMALPQLLGSSPWLGGMFVALLHGIAGWMLVRLTAEACGSRAGVVAAVLFVFAPWDVLYSDRIWLSCVAPVWGMGTLYAAHRARQGGAWLTAFVFLALVCPQLHMSAPIVWVASALLLALAPREAPWPLCASIRAVAAGGVLALLAYAPAIYWELTHGFQNTLAILQKGGGKMGLEGVLAAPFRVVGYAVLYGSSEIGYHFARGYWSPFSEVQYYASRAGLEAYLSTHGPFLAAANFVSVGLSAAAWISALVLLGREIVSALRQKQPRTLSLEARLIAALIVALGSATALMMAARKEYFPHYTNLLMPLALFPLAAFLDRALARRWIPALVAGGLSVGAMASSTFRYYRDVDALNGLQPTVEMVDRVLREPGSFSVDFAGFYNRFAWEMLARTAHDRPLPLDPRAPVHFRVENREPSREGPGERFGPVRLVRTPPEGGR